MRRNSNFWRLAGVILAISLIAFTISQQDKILTQAQRLIDYEHRINTLEVMLSEANANTQELKAENEALRYENLHLLDSIAVLNFNMAELQVKMKGHEATLKGIQEEMALKEGKIRELSTELFRLRFAKSTEVAEKQQDVQQEIEATEQQLRQLSDLQKDEENLQQHTEENLIAEEIKRKQFQQLESILKSTTITYHSVECRKKRASAPLSRMDEDGTNWIFTNLAFDLNNPNLESLSEEYFRVKIVNTDTGEELPYLESNPGFEDNTGETLGFTFQWRKNPVNIVYINMQVKNGTNYDARIYYVSEEKEYLLTNSVKPIIRSGKVVR